MEEWKEYRFSDFVSINPTVKFPSNELISFVEMKDLDSGKRFCYPSSERINGSGAKFEEYDTLFARITPIQLYCRRQIVERSKTVCLSQKFTCKKRDQ